MRQPTILNTIKFMANLVIVGFVAGRAYNEWQHRRRTLTVTAARGPRRLWSRP